MANFRSHLFELTAALGRRAPDDVTSSSEDESFEGAMPRGLVVLDGHHHTVAIAAHGFTQILFNKQEKIQNKHRRGGQSQNRFQRLAQESRACHLRKVVERMQSAFVGSDGRLLVEEIVLAGPGPMKTQLLEALPRPLARLVSATLTVARAGWPGLYDLTQVLKGERAVGAAVRAQAEEDDESDEDDEDRSQESLASLGTHKFSEDELTKILNRESKWLKKQLECDYWKQLNVLIAERLTTLQDEQETDLRTARVEDLRKALSGLEPTDEADQMILDTSLRILPMLQEASALGVDLHEHVPKRRRQGERTN